MLFNSASFLFAFLPAVLAGYFIVLRYLGKLPSQLWLFMSSLFFYAWWNPAYVFLIIGLMVFNYYLGRYLLLKADRKALFFGIAANLSVLIYYKYTAFFVAAVNTSTGADFFVPQILLPLGVSFFTFQKIAFLVDCQRRLASPNQSLVNFGLFVSFFPQLIAGPIVHHKEMMPQFAKPLPFSPYNFGAGLSLLAIGLFKKVMIADSLDAYATPLFVAAATRELHIVEAWLAALAYTFQIYFDFSGYSDMALGLGKMFNVRLPVNFFSPYKSDNIIDFWRRWHMTLSRFLRDYLYIPLGGNRKGKARRHINLFITMLLGGFWHGANWTFLVWGALHGTYLAINHFWQEKGFFKIPRPAARLITFLAVMVAWIFFRAPDMKTALSVIEALVNVKSLTHSIFDTLWTPKSPLRADFPIQMANLALALVAGCFVLCWAFPNSVEIMRKARPCIAGVRGMKLGRRASAKIIWQPTLLWGAVCGVILSLSLLRVIYEPSQVFLYFQF